MHIYYESEDIANDLRPETFAGLAIVGGDDGTHLAFILCGKVVADMRVPPGMIWEIWNALGNAASDTLRSDEYDTNDWKADVTEGRQIMPLPERARPSLPAPPPPPGPVRQPLTAGGGHVVHRPYGIERATRERRPG